MTKEEFERADNRLLDRVAVLRDRGGGVVASPFVWRDPTTIPRREFLFGRHAVRKFPSATVAAGGTGKTALAMVEAAAYVTGRDVLNDHLVTRGRAWYIGLEDPLEEYERRVAAIALHYKISPAELHGGFFLDSGRSQNFVIVRDGRNGIVVADPVVESIIDEINAHEISHVTVDPFVACHSVGENDNTAIEQVVRQWANVADKTGAAVELVHHVRKLQAGEELTADAARGAKALTDAARSVRILSGMTKDEAARTGTEERHRYFRVIHGKANLFLPVEEATWRRLATVSLGNGGTFPDDHVQVATDWTLPLPTDGVTGQQVEEVISVLASGEYRADVQAKLWAGHAVANVLKLDTDNPADKAKIKSLLKLWINNGALAKARTANASCASSLCRHQP